MDNDRAWPSSRLEIWAVRTNNRLTHVHAFYTFRLRKLTFLVRQGSDCNCSLSFFPLFHEQTRNFKKTICSSCHVKHLFLLLDELCRTQIWCQKQLQYELDLYVVTLLNNKKGCNYHYHQISFDETHTIRDPTHLDLGE